MKLNWSKWIMAALAAVSLATPAMAAELKISGDYTLEGRYYNEGDWLRAKVAGAEVKVGSWAPYQAMEGLSATMQTLQATYSNQTTYPTTQLLKNSATFTATPAAIRNVVIGALIKQGYQATDPTAPDYYGNATFLTATEALNSVQASLANTMLDPDVTMRAGASKGDTQDNDQYLKQIFNLYPELVLNDKASVKMKLSAFDNELSHEDYGEVDNPGFTEKQIDSYTVLRIDECYGDVTTPYGRFIFGKTPDFTGMGYFIKLPNLDKWAFGIINHRKDEDDSGIIYDMKNSASTPRSTNSDNYDEDGYILVAKYDGAYLDVTSKLIYGFSGSDNSDANYWKPTVRALYAKDNLKVDAFFRWTDGVWCGKDSNKAANVLYAYNSPAMQLVSDYDAAAAPDKDGLLQSLWLQSIAHPYELKTDLINHNTIATFVEASYRFDELFDTPVTPIMTLAYAEGAERPDQVDAYFDDAMTFGTWLMDDKEEDMQGYFVTPSTGYLLKDPAEHPFDRYSFSNIILARLGVNVELTKKTNLEANVIWAEKASVKYLQNYNYELGIFGLANSNVKIAQSGQYDPMKLNNTAWDPSDTERNKVKRGLGTEMNAKVTSQLNENFTFALQASYLTVGDFYKSAFEKATPFATTKQAARGLANNGYAGSGLEAEPEWALRWILQCNF